ncbi:ACT domain-containing protein [Nannocystis pusilla]|uniref:ACT domain-containing protein n=1 Tax=Nannocystis pusilla TaxID=889268 RepID=UPI003B814A3E
METPPTSWRCWPWSLSACRSTPPPSPPRGSPTSPRSTSGPPPSSGSLFSLAIGERDEHGVGLRVHPTLVPRGHVLAGVQGAFNAVLVQSDALGPSLYYGRGAGMMPTAVAVVSDILEVARDLLAGLYSRPGPTGQVPSAIPAPIALRPLADVVCAHYLRFRAPHVPGVLGRVAACLGRHGVSIRRMSQETPSDDGSAAMVMLTEPVADGPLAAALVEAALPVTRLRLLAD